MDREGAFVEPTVLTDVTPAARAYREEIFGPVAVVYRVHSVDEAITLANDSVSSAASDPAQFEGKMLMGRQWRIIQPRRVPARILRPRSCGPNSNASSPASSSPARSACPPF